MAMLLKIRSNGHKNNYGCSHKLQLIKSCFNEEANSLNRRKTKSTFYAIKNSNNNFTVAENNDDHLYY